MDSVMAQPRKRRRFLAWLVVLLALIVIPPAVWFVYQVSVYYRDIKGGNLKSLKDRRFEMTLSKTLANANVSKDDLLRLTPTGLAPELGARAARVTVVAFLDYQCPFSQTSAAPLRRVMEALGGRVHLFVRDYPITEIHPAARQSALAANCVLEQGQEKYWRFFDLHFTDQSRSSADDLRGKAALAGVKLADYDACVSSARYAQKIEQDTQVAIRTGVQGTPTFFVNGVKFQGALDEKMLSSILNTFLERQPK